MDARTELAGHEPPTDTELAKRSAQELEYHEKVAHEARLRAERHGRAAAALRAGLATLEDSLAAGERADEPDQRELAELKARAAATVERYDR